MTSRLLFPLLLLSTIAAGQTKPEIREFRTDAFRRGANEYEIWSGYSPNSFPWIGKTEARHLFMAGFGWRRVIFATDSMAWKYTVDVLPVVLVSQPTIVGSGAIFSGSPPNLTFVGCDSSQSVHEVVNDFAGVNLGPCQHPGRRTTYGFGLEPVGFDFNFRRRHRFQPLTGINGGFAKFPRDVPISNSNSFNFTFSLRGGVQIFTSESRSITIGYRYHHISNANTGNPFNPGIDSNFMYVEYSLHR
ncbi:MAG TPA: acyloxyacyl hydrolase [Terriglobales bacterium]|nr:acyloxyacyl hydrolase [Terriglobales bacterium]